MSESLMTVIKVGISDLNVVHAGQSIRTSGLGSCVGIVLYDEFAKIAGMVHIMLPHSSFAKGENINRAKFADTGIDELMKKLLYEGAQARRIKAKIAGGAQMFQFSGKNDLMRIGPRNVESVKDELKKRSIPLIAEDVGGNKGRTIEFFVHNVQLQVRTVNEGTKVI
jgi:chemotaxis protein CheD